MDVKHIYKTHIVNGFCKFYAVPVITIPANVIKVNPQFSLMIDNINSNSPFGLEKDQFKKLWSKIKKRTLNFLFYKADGRITQSLPRLN